MQASHPAARIAPRPAHSPREVGCKVAQSSLLPVSAHSSPECLTCPLGVSSVSQAPSREVGTRACARPALRPSRTALVPRDLRTSPRRPLRGLRSPPAARDLHVHEAALSSLVDAESISPWARSAAAWAIQQGVVSGYELPEARISSSRANASRANALPWCSRMRSRRAFCRNLR